MKLAWSFSERYKRRAETLRVDMDDIKSEAMIGLMLAVQRYDASRGIALSTFAYHVMQGQVRQYFRDKVPIVRRSRQEYERRLKEGEFTNIPVTSTETVLFTDKRGNEITLADTLTFDQDYSGVHVEELIASLSERERIALTMTVMGSLQSEIGRVVGVSQVHISRTMKKIKSKVTAQLADMA
jgi:RNA polymerase sporulation-specific sigma factor